MCIFYAHRVEELAAYKAWFDARLLAGHPFPAIYRLDIALRKRGPQSTPFRTKPLQTWRFGRTSFTQIIGWTRPGVPPHMFLRTLPNQPHPPWFVYPPTNFRLTAPGSITNRPRSTSVVGLTAALVAMVIIGPWTAPLRCQPADPTFDYLGVDELSPEHYRLPGTGVVPSTRRTLHFPVSYKAATPAVNTILVEIPLSDGRPGLHAVTLSPKSTCTPACEPLLL